MNTNDATSQPTTLRSKVISFFNSFISPAQTKVANDTANREWWNSNEIGITSGSVSQDSTKANKK